MAASVEASGTQSCSIGTEHTLRDTSAAAIYQFILDLTNAAAGDVFEARIYVMALTSGTRRVWITQIYADAQPLDDVIKISVPIGTPLTDSGALRFTIKQTVGSGKNVPWSVTKFV